MRRLLKMGFPDDGTKIGEEILSVFAFQMLRNVVFHPLKNRLILLDLASLELVGPITWSEFTIWHLTLHNIRSTNPELWSTIQNGEQISPYSVGFSLLLGPSN